MHLGVVIVSLTSPNALCHVRTEPNVYQGHITPLLEYQGIDGPLSACKRREILKEAQSWRSGGLNGFKEARTEAKGGSSQDFVQKGTVEKQQFEETVLVDRLREAVPGNETHELEDRGGIEGHRVTR